jgi:hypothetical protein
MLSIVFERRQLSYSINSHIHITPIALLTINNAHHIMPLCLRLDDLVPRRNQLLNLLVLVLQQAQRERNFVPLPLRLAPLQSRRQLGR